MNLDKFLTWLSCLTRMSSGLNKRTFLQKGIAWHLASARYPATYAFLRKLYGTLNKTVVRVLVLSLLKRRQECSQAEEWCSEGFLHDFPSLNMDSAITPAYCSLWCHLHPFPHKKTRVLGLLYGDLYLGNTCFTFQPISSTGIVSFFFVKLN